MPYTSMIMRMKVWYVQYTHIKYNKNVQQSTSSTSSSSDKPRRAAPSVISSRSSSVGPSSSTGLSDYWKTTGNKLLADNNIHRDYPQTCCVDSTTHGLSVSPQAHEEFKPDNKSEKQHFSVMNISWSSGFTS